MPPALIATTGAPMVTASATALQSGASTNAASAAAAENESTLYSMQKQITALENLLKVHK